LRESKTRERYLKHQEEVKEHATHRFEKLTQKMHLARLNQEACAKQLSHRSDSGYVSGLKEMREISARKIEMDRRHSKRHYEYLKKKLDEEENLSKKQGMLM
jgi:hypothetical protein